MNCYIFVIIAESLYCSHLYRDCQLGEAKSLDAFAECVMACEADNTTESALLSVIKYADFCQVSLSLTYWPAQPLCNHFGNAPFPLWIGDNCDILCVYGTKDANNRNVCICNPGYWNVSCDMVCPGGSTNPCNGVGICNVLTGECECPVNWKGTPDCLACTPGWTGVNCSLSSTHLRADINVRISSIGFSYLTTFTGYTFRFYIVGEYHLLIIGKTQFIMQAKFVYCFTGKSCMQAVGFYFGNSNHGFASITISAAQKPGERMTVRLNNKLYQLDTSLVFGTAGYVFTRLSLTEILCTGPNDLRVIVRASGLHLTLHTEFPDTLCPISEGLLVGGCCNAETNSSSLITLPESPPGCSYMNNTATLQPSPDDGTEHDFILDDDGVVSACEAVSATDQPATINDLINAWALSEDCDSFLDYPDTTVKYQLQLSFNLLFQQSFIYSQSLILLTPVKYDVTFDISVKISNTLGVILSFSHYTTFSLYLDTTLNIHIGSLVYATSLRPVVDEWTKIIIVYTSADHYVTLYLNSVTQGTLKETVKLIDNFDFFQLAGYLALGSWIPGWDDVGVPALPGFSGLIDAIRLWNR